MHFTSYYTINSIINLIPFLIRCWTSMTIYFCTIRLCVAFDDNYFFVLYSPSARFCFSHLSFSFLSIIIIERHLRWQQMSYLQFYYLSSRLLIVYPKTKYFTIFTVYLSSVFCYVWSINPHIRYLLFILLAQIASFQQLHLARPTDMW